MRAAILMCLVAVFGFGCGASTPEPRATFTPEQLDAAQKIVAAMEGGESIRDMTQQSTVVVGPGFFLLDYKEKEIGCRAMDIVRQNNGLREGFILRESMNDREVGSYVSGYLSMKE